MADAATAPVSPYGYSSPQQVQLLSSTYLRDFQEPFRFYLNPSLSELQSWRSSISSTSSGMPGPGHLSGKAIEWVGERILDAITPLEIRRRIWLIKRFVGRLEKEPEGTRWKWLLKKQKSFPRLANDLLELSSYRFSFKLLVFIAKAYYCIEMHTGQNIESYLLDMAIASTVLWRRLIITTKAHTGFSL